jgi:hypothetical protein
MPRAEECHDLGDPPTPDLDGHEGKRAESVVVSRTVLPEP